MAPSSKDPKNEDVPDPRNVKSPKKGAEPPKGDSVSNPPSPPGLEDALTENSDVERWFKSDVPKELWDKLDEEPPVYNGVYETPEEESAQTDILPNARASAPTAPVLRLQHNKQGEGGDVGERVKKAAEKAFAQAEERQRRQKAPERPKGQPPADPSNSTGAYTPDQIKREAERLAREQEAETPSGITLLEDLTPGPVDRRSDLKVPTPLVVRERPPRSQTKVASEAITAPVVDPRERQPPREPLRKQEPAKAMVVREPKRMKPWLGPGMIIISCLLAVIIYKLMWWWFG